MTMQLIDPFIADLNLISSVDLQTQMTDYVDLLLVFPDEQATNTLFWHLDSHSDPVTSKINFFKQLNSSEIKIKDNPDGVKKRELDVDKMQNVNFRAQLPDYVNVVTDSGDKYGKVMMAGADKVEVKQTTVTRTWKSQTDDDVHASGEWLIEENSKQTKANVTKLLDIQKSGPELASTFGMKDMTAWFMMWWIEKFNASHHVIKKDLKELLGDQNEYFVNFSESVGQLKNVTDAYDSSTLPIWDLNTDMYGDQFSIPSVIPGVGAYATKTDSKAFSKQLSRQTNKVYRSNLVAMMDDPSRDDIIPGPVASFSTSSHGINMVCDSAHASRFHGSVGDIMEAVQLHLKGLYGVLDLLSNRENYMVVNKPRQILMNVEGFTTSVDLLKNKISNFTASTTDDTTHTRYGKYTKYNNNRANAKKLGANDMLDFFS